MKEISVLAADVLVDTGAMYIRVTLYCGHLIILRPFHLGISCTVFVLTLRRLMSDIYMQHPFLMFLDHTQRRNTVGRTPLDE